MEREIVSLEAKTGLDNNELMEASVKGDSGTIKRLSKTIHDSRSRIESLFSELERLHIDLEDRTKEFEEKLSGMEA